MFGFHACPFINIPMTRFPTKRLCFHKTFKLQSCPNSFHGTLPGESITFWWSNSILKSRKTFNWFLDAWIHPRHHPLLHHKPLKDHMFYSKMPFPFLVLISDTHSRHASLGKLPPGDLLIHAGDFTQTRPSKPKVTLIINETFPLFFCLEMLQFTFRNTRTLLIGFHSFLMRIRSSSSVKYNYK